jgi:hypothetical protein
VFCLSVEGRTENTKHDQIHGSWELGAGNWIHLCGCTLHRHLRCNSVCYTVISDTRSQRRGKKKLSTHSVINYSNFLVGSKCLCVRNFCAFFLVILMKRPSKEEIVTVALIWNNIRKLPNSVPIDRRRYPKAEPEVVRTRSVSGAACPWLWRCRRPCSCPCRRRRRACRSRRRRRAATAGRARAARAPWPCTRRARARWSGCAPPPAPRPRRRPPPPA